MNNSVISNIGQVDGIENDDNLSSSSDGESDSDSSVTDYETEDEVEPDVNPIELPPKSIPNNRKPKILKASSLPLVTLMTRQIIKKKS